MNLTWLVIAVACIFTGCSNVKFMRYSQEDYESCIASVSDVTSLPGEIENLGGECLHAIGGFQDRNKPSYDWTSYVWLESRYAISCSIPVGLNNQHDSVTEVLGEPEFCLTVVGTISDNGHGADIDQQIRFGPDKWAQMVACKNDLKKMFQILGVEYNPDPLPFFKEYVALLMPLEEYRTRINPKR